MFVKLFQKIFGNNNSRILKKMQLIVNSINDLENHFSQLSDQELQNQTKFLKKCLKTGKTLNDLLPHAFAVVREASKRVLNMRHFDVQLLGGIILHNNCIAEMRTGEGKTLTATLPAYLNALEENGVHIITMNEYLVNRDAKKHRILFEFLGLTVGVNISGMSILSKQNAYLSDIIYGTNNEFCFDYLRDNMIFHYKERVQRELHYALIDEIDSILIDESRTPLIISGSSENVSEIYFKINNIIPFIIRKNKKKLDCEYQKKYFVIDEKSKNISLTEQGLITVEYLLIKNKIMASSESLYSSDNIIFMYRVITALRAHIFFKKNVDYIVKDKKIMIVDQHTGRIMLDRRWSDGLHQAIEAKENVKIFHENQTLASITFQNYFKLYKKISGMTGTAETEACEFQSIYNLNTIIIPTNCPMIRNDMPDLVYVTESEKINAIIEDIKVCFLKKQPVLVGTISIEKSEIISKKLHNIGIDHNVLNAKFHAKEAEIISTAGKSQAVTISTNMAGRGTDIVLGGTLDFTLSCNSTKQSQQYKTLWQQEHDFVVSVGGLHIIGTERHDSRRIDNQLIGRSGRQGDPGSSRFYLSMEDPLMRIFSSEKVKNMMRTLGVKFGESIEHNWITKAILHAQQKVENQNFEVRKQLLEYDNILHEQRYIIYSKRNDIINAQNIDRVIQTILKQVILNITYTYCPSHVSIEKWDIDGISLILKTDFNCIFFLAHLIKKNCNILNTTLSEKIFHLIQVDYKKKAQVIGLKKMREIEKNIMLKHLDSLWKEHLSNMEYLRKGIHFRRYAQQDPHQEYKRESFVMFSNMLETLKYQVVSYLVRSNIF